MSGEKRLDRYTPNANRGCSELGFDAFIFSWVLFCVCNIVDNERCIMFAIKTKRVKSVCMYFNGPERKDRIQTKIYSDTPLCQSRFLSPSLENTMDKTKCVRPGLALVFPDEGSPEGLSPTTWAGSLPRNLLHVQALSQPGILGTGI